MILSYYAARANVYHLWQQHPEWEHATLAAALGSSKGWVKKWLKRFREEQAAGVPLADILPGHSRARKHPPSRRMPWWSNKCWPYAISPPKACGACRVNRPFATTSSVMVPCCSSNSPCPRPRPCIVFSKPMIASPSPNNGSISPWSARHP